MKGHAERALECLISALRAEGVVIQTYSQGVGAPAGLLYTVRTEQRDIADCNADNGLGVNDDVSPRLAGIVRAHCTLYYALYPTRD